MFGFVAVDSFDAVDHDDDDDDDISDVVVVVVGLIYYWLRLLCLKIR